LYGAIEAALERRQATNAWLLIGLREGKNREIKRVMEHMGLAVTRLIRVSFGPFQLGDLPSGEVREIKGRVLRDQLGPRLAADAGIEIARRPVVQKQVANSGQKRPAATRRGKFAGRRR
jgi:23S rRNA pseudouridine2605 synthase